MIKKLAAVLIFVLSINIVYGQNGQLQINGQKRGANESELQAAFVPDGSLQNGFAIRLPDDAKSSLLAVQLNGAELWLKRSPEKPDKADAVHWQKNPDGFTLLFNPNVLPAGTRFGIKLHIAALPDKEREAGVPFIISAVRPAPDGKYISGQEIVRQDLPKIQDN